MTTSSKPSTEGRARSPGISVQELLDAERVPVPEVLRKTGHDDLGSDPIPAERYTSREFHELELEKMWTRVWQMVCREEEIPNVGDHVVYEIGDWSLLVMRSAEDRIQGFYNVCLHRGRLLRTQSGNVAKLRCPFHGFTWNLDGSLREVPCAWDFPHVKPEEFGLPEVKVDTWGGFVFVNMDEHAAPLADYLGDLPEEFAAWDYENRWKRAHVGKIVDMNWKVGVEAFIESFHVLATHPQIMPSTGDTNTQYDVQAGAHYNRMITAMGTPSPHLGDTVDRDAIIRSMTYSDEKFEIPEGVSAREFVGELRRKMLEESTGRDYSDATVSELLDAIQYWVFPNFFPWGGVTDNLIYRFRPWGGPDKALMEVMFLSPVPEGQPRPKPAKMRLLGDDEDWTDAWDELGPVAAVFQQDMANMPIVHRGLKSMKDGRVTIADYQESRIRHLHHMLERYCYGVELRDAREA